MSSVWTAVAVVAVGAITAGVQASSAEDAEDESYASRQQGLSTNRATIARFQALIDELPAEKQEAMARITASYGQQALLLDEAKARGDVQAAELFATQLDMIKTSMATELSAVGAAFTDYVAVADELKNEIRDSYESDEQASEKFRVEYDKSSKDAIARVGKMADVMGARFDQIVDNGGLAPEASATISTMRQKLVDVKRVTEQAESARGKGGSASRLSGLAIESVKALSSLTADMYKSGVQEMAQLSELLQGNAALEEDLASDRYANLEVTTERDISNATRQIDLGKLDAQGDKNQRELGILSAGNLAEREVVGSREIGRAHV